MATLAKRKRRPVVGGVVNSGFGDTTRQGRKRAAREAAGMLAKLERDKRLASVLLPTVAEARKK